MTAYQSPAVVAKARRARAAQRIALLDAPPLAPTPHFYGATPRPASRAKTKTDAAAKVCGCVGCVNRPRRPCVLRDTVATTLRLEDLRTGAGGGDVTSAIDVAPEWHRPGVRKPFVLAFDPGSRTGWALARESGETSTGVIRPKGRRIDTCWADGVRDKLSHLRQLSELGGAPAVVLVEDVFLATGDKANPRTLSVLAFYVGGIVSLAAALSLPVWLVPASKWKAAIVGHAPNREIGKERAEAFARARGFASLTEHEAEAVCLATYGRGPFGAASRPFKGAP